MSEDRQNSYVFECEIFPDAGCARDFALAMRLDGIARRKALAELTAHDCMRHLDAVYYVTINGTDTIRVQGDASLQRPPIAVVVHNCTAIFDSGVNDLLGRQPQDASEIVVEGWLLDEDIIKMTEAED